MLDVPKIVKTFSCSPHGIGTPPTVFTNFVFAVAFKFLLILKNSTMKLYLVNNKILSNRWLFRFYWRLERDVTIDESLETVSEHLLLKYDGTTITYFNFMTADYTATQIEVDMEYYVESFYVFKSEIGLSYLAFSHYITPYDEKLHETILASYRPNEHLSAVLNPLQIPNHL